MDTATLVTLAALLLGFFSGLGLNGFAPLAAGIVLSIVGGVALGSTAEDILRVHAGPGTSFLLIVMLLILYGLGWLTAWAGKTYFSERDQTNQ